MLRRECLCGSRMVFLIALRQLAIDIAEAAPPERSIILDAFCGVGGNSIAFALSGRWKRVYAIEKDKATLECAQANAKIYGVFEKITWFHGDCFEILASEGESSVPALSQVLREYGVIFVSTPWGGKLLHQRPAIHISDNQLQDLATRHKLRLMCNRCSHTV